MSYQAGEVEALLDGVCDQGTFITFLEALANDFDLERQLEVSDPSGPYGPGKLGWENGTVDNVLGAAASWADATQRNWPADGDPNIWNRCAHILLMGKYYE